MRSIDKILEYSLTKQELGALFYWEIVNGCWWKWGISFDKILKDNLEIIPWFGKKKSEKLYEDIRMICVEHDIDFRFSKGFYKSNYKFASKIYKLLHWAKFSHRFSIKFICFFLLCKYWKAFYFIKK